MPIWYAAAIPLVEFETYLNKLQTTLVQAIYIWQLLYSTATCRGLMVPTPGHHRVILCCMCQPI